VKIYYKKLNYISCIARLLAKASLLLMIGCQSQPQMFRDNRILMGTYVEVISPDRRAAVIVFDEFRRLEKLLSKYDPESEVSQLNSNGTINAGPDLFYLVTRAKEFWFATDGAFDITVGPLMSLWGFTTKQFRLPQEDEIIKILPRIGMNKVIIDQGNNTIKFNTAGMEIDLGAIGKGYAVDRAAALLKANGINSCLINAGGQIYCLGANNGKPWRVAIKDRAARILLARSNL